MVTAWTLCKIREMCYFSHISAEQGLCFGKRTIRDMLEEWPDSDTDCALSKNGAFSTKTLLITKGLGELTSP